MIIYVIYQPVQLLLQIHRQPTDMTESIRSDHFEWIGLDRKKTAMQISNPSHLELVDDRDGNDKTKQCFNNHRSSHSNSLRLINSIFT